MAQGSGQLGMPAAVALTQALVSALLMNVCIVGLNQLYDVEIDKVNKPYLPLASGEMTMRQARPAAYIDFRQPSRHLCVKQRPPCMSFGNESGPSSSHVHEVCLGSVEQFSAEMPATVRFQRISKQLSQNGVLQGQWVVAVSGAMALALGVASQSIPLIATLAGSLALGIVYSAELPFLRWKRHPVLAAACILAVR